MKASLFQSQLLAPSPQPLLLPLRRNLDGRAGRDCGRGGLLLVELREGFAVYLYLAVLFEASARARQEVVEDLLAALVKSPLRQLRLALLEVFRLRRFALLDAEHAPRVAALHGRLRRLALLELEDGRVERGVCAGRAERAAEVEALLVL